jgi:hypothetical protein
MLLLQVRLFGHGSVESDNEGKRGKTTRPHVKIRMSLTMVTNKDRNEGCEVGGNISMTLARMRMARTLTFTRCEKKMRL